MKRVLLVLVIAAVLLFAGGCSFLKTYYYAFGDAATGFCEQVTTNDGATQSDLVTGGFTEGTCSANGFATSHYCTTTSTTYGSGSVSISIYWGTSISPTDIQTACTSSGWTYH
jgi:hypothetical protein